MANSLHHVKPSEEPVRRTPSQRHRKAVLYARVSSEEQEKEGFSIPAQLKLLRDYALQQGLDLVSEYLDVETAKKPGRPGFTAMVAFFNKETKRKHLDDRCRVLLVEKTDRLYRNLKDYVTIDDLDVEVHFVKENVVLSPDSHSSEKFMHGIKVLMAKNYVDNLGEEVRKGLREKAEQGVWPRKAPLGYRNFVRPDGKKGIEPDPDSAPLVRRMFEWYATGNYSLHQVVQMVKDSGLNFGRCHNLAATAHAIFCNRIYYGEFKWNGKIYQGVHAPLIPRELWQRVQEMMRRRGTRKPRRVRHVFAFSGLLTCGHCGCALVGEIKKGRYIYYHCTGYKGKCPERYVREEVLEARFTKVLRDLRFDADVLGWVTEALRESHVDERQFHEAAVAKLRAEYDRLQNRIDSMYLDKLDGRISVEFFDAKSSEWRVEQRRILQAMHDHQAANENYLEEGVRLLELANHAAELFEKQEPREKRRLLDFVLSNSSWKGGELVPQYRQPFEMIGHAATACADRKATGSSPDDLHQVMYPRQDSNLQPTD
jgi:site-specific DNA recombinase